MKAEKMIVFLSYCILILNLSCDDQKIVILNPEDLVIPEDVTFRTFTSEIHNYSIDLPDSYEFKKITSREVLFGYPELNSEQKLPRIMLFPDTLAKDVPPYNAMDMFFANQIQSIFGDDNYDLSGPYKVIIRDLKVFLFEGYGELDEEKVKVLQVFVIDESNDMMFGFMFGAQEEGPSLYRYENNLDIFYYMLYSFDPR